MPFIRPMQKAFFAEQCREMLNLVKEDGETGAARGSGRSLRPTLDS